MTTCEKCQGRGVIFDYDRYGLSRETCDCVKPDLSEFPSKLRVEFEAANRIQKDLIYALEMAGL